MISKKAIDQIYKKFDKRPETPDLLDIILLFENVDPAHNITIDGNDIVIGSVETWSPFHRIPLDRVHAIVEFEENVGIVLHSSIVFLGRRSPDVHVHVKQQESSLMSRLLGFVGA